MVVATITEIPPLLFLPNFLVQRKVLRPLRTQTGGTIMVGISTAWFFLCACVFIMFLIGCADTFFRRLSTLICQRKKYRSWSEVKYLRQIMMWSAIKHNIIFRCFLQILHVVAFHYRIRENLPSNTEFEGNSTETACILDMKYNSISSPQTSNIHNKTLKSLAF